MDSYLKDIQASLPQTLPNLTPTTLALLTLLTLSLILLYHTAYTTNIPPIPRLPSAPSPSPFIGHLAALGGRSRKNDASIYTSIAQSLSTSIFQCNLGNQRTVVVGSWKMVKELWVDKPNRDVLRERPEQPGFVDKLGVDITGECMTEQIRRCRMAAMRALGKLKWEGYWGLLEPNSVKLVGDVFEKGENGKRVVDVYPWIRCVVFDLALGLTYGARMGEVDDAFALSFLKSINDISEVRSSTRDYKHFVPLLRLFPQGTTKTIAAERVRQKHLDILFAQYNEKLAAGETVNCLVSAFGEDKLSMEEIHGTCVSLLQAAPDTIASGVYQCIAWLCSSTGQPFQEQVYKAILAAYNGNLDQAWKMAFYEEKVPLVTSLYKETLRYFTPTPIAVPRSTNQDISYLGTALPKGVTLIMNAQQANHDVEWYGDDADIFNPERFLGNDGSLPHLSYGAGSRICPAVGISNRIMSALIVRLILAFEMKEVEGMRMPNINMIDFSDVYVGLVAQPKTFDCSFKARDEVWLKSVTEGT